MIVRARVADGIWWVAYQMEDKGKITPIKEEVVAFQGEEERQNPPYYQALPCPKCGTNDDRKHDPLKHVYVELGK